MSHAIEKNLLLLHRKWGCYLRRLGMRLGLLNGHGSYTKFIILCAPRTGSNFLRSLLNSHRQVIAFGEIFRNSETIGWDLPGYFQDRKRLKLYAQDPVEFLSSAVFAPAPTTISAVGLKMFYHHAQTGRTSNIWPFLRNLEGLCIIHLKRKNLLRAYISYEKATKSRRWVKSNALREPDLTVILDHEKAKQKFHEMRSCERYFDDYFKGKKRIEVFYEDLCLNFKAEMDQIQAFLNLPQEKLFSSVFKQSYRSLSESIQNYADLKQSFKGTRWEAFLDDETG